MSKPKPARYRTTNWSAYNDALRKRGSLRRQKTLKVQIPYRRANVPLNLLVDTEPWRRHCPRPMAKGIKFLGDGEWQIRRHGSQARRQWRKVHLARDTATSDIRALAFTPGREGDSPVLPDLLGQTPVTQKI